ncbi:RloB family protein [Streptomyces sp. NPDC002690]
MKRGKPLKRTKGAREEQRRFLIYCEGECTEEQYFKGLRADLRALPVTIQLGGRYGEPRSLVREAIAHKERAPRSSADRWTSYDEVWCVIDVEAPVPHPTLPEALRLAERNGIGVVRSDPCFELWLLLHFQDSFGYLTSDQAQRTLEKLGVCGYSSNRKHLDFEALRTGHADARGRAQALRERATKVAEGRAVNPWTDVDRLVEVLKESRGRRP